MSENISDNISSDMCASTSSGAPAKDVHAWRLAIAGGDPEVKMFCDAMFHVMEDRVFADLNGYVLDEGRKLASKVTIYANSKGYDFSEDEVLSGFKAAAPQIQGMVKASWEKVLGEYFHGEIARGEAARAAEAAKRE